MNKGYLIVRVFVDSIANPVVAANVLVDGINYKTDEFGKTEKISLNTVDKKYSLEDQNEVMPYYDYEIIVSKEGLCKKVIDGVEIFDGELSIQDVYLNSIDEECSNNLDISPITLWGDYPNTNLDVSEPLVLNKVEVPEYIIVHDGNPNNNSAADYNVNFIDYIKNVASSEIYSTWPTETIKANVIAIISFALNRIYTEWYKSRGYNFTITSTTTYDQKYTHGRTIFDSISKIVDDVFTTYIKRSGNNYPLLAQYRANTTTPGIMSQWGSKDLGDKGYKADAILKHYYGNIALDKAPVSSSYPVSFKGVTLRVGDCNEQVYTIENQLNYIRGSYPGIPVISNADGFYDENTKRAVAKFQQVFNLSATGEVDFTTWYKISYVYVAVSKMIKSIYY